jgi:hypothetical protein
MRGRWWGLAVLLAATTLAVSANPTSRASSSADSVTIPLILRQPGAKQPPKKAEPPKKEEPKSPQDILEEAKPTPVAMQSADVPPSVPLLEAPPAPTLDPTLPTTPELFVPDLMGPLPPPKPQVVEPKPQPKKLVPALVTPPEPKAQPALNPEPKHPTPLPREKPRAAVMEPVDDVKPESLRKIRGAKSPALVPQEEPAQPRPIEMQPVDDSMLGSLRAAPDGKPPSFRCVVRDVMAFRDRTHVRCHNMVQGKVSYFAVDTNQPVAETVVTKALAAMKSGKPLTIAFAPDADLNPSNCGPKNCRRLIDIEN